MAAHQNKSYCFFFTEPIFTFYRLEKLVLEIFFVVFTVFVILILVVTPQKFDLINYRPFLK